MTTGVFVDTAVAAYAYGLDHRCRDPARQVISDAEQGTIELHASVGMIQELVHHRMRKVDRPRAVAESRDMALLCILHPFDRQVLEVALQLLVDVDGLGGRDAVHAATALVAGVDRIISPDPAFDAVPGLTRVPLA